MSSVEPSPTKLRPRSWWKRPGPLVLGGALAAVACYLARPVVHLVATAQRDVDQREALPAGYADDASRMNRTAVSEVWSIPADPALAELQLTALLQRAQAAGLPVSIAGARHSMGGHTIAPDGIVIDMLPFRRMEWNEATDLLWVQAGALWSDIIPYLDRRGRSVAVMQSNNSFSVGGSISVNCHGWQFGQPPIASTVESLRLMRADGVVVRCSRTENPELFSLVLGGYGLFGVVLDVELRVIPNERYRLHQSIVPVDEALPAFDELVQNRSDVAMVYARMSIVPDRLFQDVILNVFYRDPAPDGSLPELSAAGLVELRRSLFRGSAGSDYGKGLRWQAETRLQPHLQSRYFSRNQLLNEGADVFQNRSADSTDILHEYFVPREGLAAFVDELQRIVPEHPADLLNVTVRSIETDRDSFLRYADRPYVSFVMLFQQPRTAEADAEMRALTRELIDASLRAGGRYYLPYRLHATVEQFQRAYPQAQQFFKLKRKYDPMSTFQNRFYLDYGAQRGTDG